MYTCFSDCRQGMFVKDGSLFERTCEQDLLAVVVFASFVRKDIFVFAVSEVHKIVVALARMCERTPQVFASVRTKIVGRHVPTGVGVASIRAKIGGRHVTTGVGDWGCKCTCKDRRSSRHNVGRWGWGGKCTY